MKDKIADILKSYTSKHGIMASSVILESYADELVKNGVVVLPCKVGDMVYEPNIRGFVSVYKIISFHISKGSTRVSWDLIEGIYSNINGFEISALGESVFLTKEEAEKH